MLDNIHSISLCYNLHNNNNSEINNNAVHEIWFPLSKIILIVGMCSEIYWKVYVLIEAHQIQWTQTNNLYI